MNETGTSEVEEELLDYFSRLPECVVHHILSILPFKDVVRCSVLSKTWNRIWFNYPNIALTLRANISYHPHGSQRPFLDHIEGILEQCLFRKAFIQKLQLRITTVSNLEEFSPNMDRWLRVAIERNVSELVLEVTSYMGLYLPEIYYSIPERVVVAHSLKVLEVTRCRFEGDRFTCIELSHLHKLKLRWCQFVGENVLNKILSGCPVLESLEVNCQGVGSLISISCNPRLKYFGIGGGGIELKRIEIFSPSLETFKYISGNPYADIDLDICTALKHLNLKQAYLSNDHLPIEYLLPKLLCIESLELHDCKAVGEIKISSPCLKRLILIYPAPAIFPGAKIESPNLLDLDFSALGVCSLGFKFSSWNVPKLENFHMVFSVKSFSTAYRGGLEDFLMKFLHNYGSLKLLIAMAACEEGHNLILHEKLLAVPFSTLNKFMIKGITEYVAISSWREEHILTKALNSGRCPIRLSLIFYSRQSIELLYKKLSKDESLYPFNTIQLVSTEEIKHEMDSTWKSFINTYSIGYHTATIIFDWDYRKSLELDG